MSALLLLFGLLVAVIAGAGPMQHDPMSPHEEYEWLKALGLTDAEIAEIQQ